MTHDLEFRLTLHLLHMIPNKTSSKVQILHEADQSNKIEDGRTINRKFQDLKITPVLLKSNQKSFHCTL